MIATCRKIEVNFFAKKEYEFRSDKFEHATNKNEVCFESSAIESQNQQLKIVEDTDLYRVANGDSNDESGSESVGSNDTLIGYT